MDRNLQGTDYLMFLAFDTGKRDDNDKRIMQYQRVTQGFPFEEISPAVEWLTKQLLEDVGVAKSSRMDKDMAAKVFNPKVEPEAPMSKALQIASFLKDNMKHDPKINDKVFGVMQELKKINPGDEYYEAYQDHWKRQGDKFYDHYHLAWQVKELPIRNMMEIGSRTGTSMCQFLSALKDAGGEHTTYPPKIVSFDLFNDGFISPELIKLNLKYLKIPVEPEFITGNSLETVPEYHKNNPDVKFDWILVDGCHDMAYARQDLTNVVPMIAEGGIVVFDDISTAPGECALLPVWEEFKDAHKDEFYFFENMNGKGVGVGVRRNAEKG